MKSNYKRRIFAAFAALAVVGTMGVLAACNNNEDEVKLVYAAPNGEFTGNVYYVAPYGKRDNEGTTASKAKDPGFINDKSTLKAGDTVYLVPGTYKWDASWGANQPYKAQAIGITVSGEPNKYVNFINAALDPRSGYTGEETKVTLDFSAMEFNSSNRGVQIYGDYIYWYGIDVCGAGDNGMYIGGSFNIIEYSEFYNNRDSGLQLGREESSQTNINQWPSYNLIKNCTSHNNYDDETYGENADGFAAKLTVGYGNVFDGCIAYRNSDDGWDLYAKSDSGNIGCVIIYNCVAFENGYLEYTQAEMHEKLNYNPAYNEPETRSYKTRDGDGNGFKLGGSVMEGDVRMYNCLAFQNRMHGVTDNSNPGFLLVEGVTSYDNSAAIDDNPNSEYFGKVVSISNHDTHGNIDVARQTYSYNSVKNVLSVKSSIAKSLDKDAYRGSVTDSLLNADANTNVVSGSIDANTKISSAKQYTSQISSLAAEDVFKTLPVVAKDGGYTYNIDGARDLDRPVEQRVHDLYRNADHSINMGNLLAVKEDFDFSTYFGEGKVAGSYLNLGTWGEYIHFTDDDLFEGVSSRIYAELLKAKETLIIYTDADAVYQDFDVPVKLQDATVAWATDSELLEIGRISSPAPAASSDNISKAEYITIGVIRPTDGDKKATLTATISYLNRSVTKQFEVVIKKDQPTIGELSVRVAETDEIYVHNGKIIMDAYKQYTEPVLEVENGAYYNGTLLTKEQYDVVTTYEYATSATAAFTAVPAFMVNHPGVYRITHNVTLKGGNESASMSYIIFVAATGAEVDFADGGSVSVFRDGYIIAGELANVTGTIYTVAAETELADLTAANIKEYAGVLHNDFRATNISFSYKNPNNRAYHIYYALANVDGEVTSKLYHVAIGTVNISTAEQFNTIATGGTINKEEVSQTIYLLTQDIDFNGYTWKAGKSAFKGVLNGQGHTVKNLVRNDKSSDDTGIFYDVVGGTIMNVKFDNIQLTGKQRTGIVSSAHGGYFYNIAITNLLAYGNDQRTGGLIAHVYEGATPTEVSQVSIINPMPEYNATTGALDASKAGQYYIYGTGNRVAGIIGFIQGRNPITNNMVISVRDCYVESYIFCGGYSISAMVGEYNENGQASIAALNGWTISLTIENCVSHGVLVGSGSGRIGGMLGYHNGSTPLTVRRCFALQKAYYKGALLDVAQKNQSPVIGNYSTSAQVSVTQCIAMMEEHNTDYDVTVYTLFQMSIAEMSGYSSFINEKWSFVFQEGSLEYLESPYLRLNFLGNWD